MSHPVWVRGLKQSYITTLLKGKLVAPRVGAWIETDKCRRKRVSYMVAPRVGAWIETVIYHYITEGKTCRTPCGCVD